MRVVISKQGDVRCLYQEAIDLSQLGRLTIARASHVEPDDQGRWRANLAPVNGPQLGPFARRSDALQAEQVWLDANWLTQHGPA